MHERGGSNEYGDISIEVVGPTSFLLDEVVALWRPNAGRLGFFPEGAFIDRAKQGQILAALSGASGFLGYLLYRVTNRGVATIVHLCTSPKARGKGVARLLFNDLKRRESKLRGVQISCRRDFEANTFWPKIGFTALGERPGRRGAGSTLIIWWYGLDQKDLFSSFPASKDDTLLVALDVNVFLDLLNRTNEESEGLEADWLEDEVTLAVTPELTTELYRREEKRERDAAIQFSRRFEQLHGSQSDFDILVAELEEKFASPQSDQARSDLRQIARAAVATADIFLTRDDRLLKARDAIHSVTGVRISRPSELITEIDASLQRRSYQRVRLAGTILPIQRAVSADEDQLATAFQNTQHQERKSEFLAPIRKILASPDKGQVLVTRGHDGFPIGLIGFENTDWGALSIPRIRIAQSSIPASLARYLVNLVVRHAVMQKNHTCVVDDDGVQPSIGDALKQEGFQFHEGLWVKVSLSGVLSISEAVQAIQSLINRAENRSKRAVGALNGILATLERVVTKSEVGEFLSVEELLWPVILADFEIPAFLVPIRPGWAHHLFDEEIANGQLFGAKLDLALNDEAIYYRSVLNHGGLAAPGRVIWYVSQDRKLLPVGQIRAISHLREVFSGAAHETYKKFRRLGIYEWKDVLGTAKKKPNGHVMALRFCRTQLVAHPMSHMELQNILRSFEIATQIQSPVQISHPAFLKIARKVSLPS